MNHTLRWFVTAGRQSPAYHQLKVAATAHTEPPSASKSGQLLARRAQLLTTHNKAYASRSDGTLGAKQTGRSLFNLKRSI
jgi:hypothetical protein